MSFQCDDVDAGRKWIIKGVCVYMGEDPEDLIQEYVVCVLFIVYTFFHSYFILILMLSLDYQLE